ncbi:MAG: 50S ribosomal protein L11 methyltransferase [Myxococcaceae bacterium]|nr:50S ribosomal protein L11 methyltransferase [Myxococcaceae bacterium]
MQVEALETLLRRVVVAPQLEAWVAPSPVPLWEALEARTGSLLPPPFFAHAWPGSLALVEALRADAGLVAGRSVLDFACGGALAGIVAAQLGARVCCNDIDPLALATAQLNAQLNRAEIDTRLGDVVGHDDGWQVLLVGDVFYEAPLAARVTAWLDRLAARGALVLVGDPGRQFLPLDRVSLVSTHALAPNPAWDSVTDRPARVWRWSAA